MPTKRVIPYALTVWHTEMHTNAHQLSLHDMYSSSWLLITGLLDKFQVPCWKDKPVLLSVYVERPKRRPASLTHHHHHHHHHHHYVHHTIKREAISHRDGAAGKGYTTSRRAELLQYSQRLRQSAGRAPESSSSSTPYVPNPNHTSNPQPQAEVPC